MRIKVEVGYVLEPNKVVVDVDLGREKFEIIDGEVVKGDASVLEMTMLEDDYLKFLIENAISYAADFQFRIRESQEAEI